MSLLSIIQDVAANLGLPSPVSVINNADRNVAQLLTFANEEGRELVRQYNWPVMAKEAVFTTTAASLQGTMASLAGSDYLRVSNFTAWNRSNMRPTTGPISPEIWQWYKARNISGPMYNIRIMQDPSTRKESLYMLPAPTAGMTMAFEYFSKNWVVNAAGSATFDAFQADTDTTMIDEMLITYGTRWRWLKRKGLDWQPDYQSYREMLMTQLGQQGGSNKLSLGMGGLNWPLINQGSIPDGNF